MRINSGGTSVFVFSFHAFPDYGYSKTVDEFKNVRLLYTLAFYPDLFTLDWTCTANYNLRSF